MQIDIDKDVEIFISSLEKPAIVKLLRTIDLLERFGHRLGMPHSKKIEHDLFELRVHGRQAVRIFYTFKTERAVLLHGFIKKTQESPHRELRHALAKLRLLT